MVTYARKTGIAMHTRTLVQLARNYREPIASVDASVAIANEASKTSIGRF